MWLQRENKPRYPLPLKNIFIRTFDAINQFVLIYEQSLNGLMGRRITNT